MNSYLRNSAINAHLRQVPECEWPERVEALILIGIKSLRGQELTQSQLWSIANSICSYPHSLQELENQLLRFKQDLGNNNRSVHKSLSIKKSLGSLKGTQRRSDSNTEEAIPKDSNATVQSPKSRKIPSYLKGVNSKIKPVVQKDRKKYKKLQESPRNNATSEPPRGRIINLSSPQSTPQQDKTKCSAKYSPSMEDILINLDSNKKDNFEFSLNPNKQDCFVSPKKRQIEEVPAFSPFVSSVKKTSYSMVERSPPSYIYGEDP